MSSHFHFDLNLVNDYAAMHHSAIVEIAIHELVFQCQRPECDSQYGCFGHANRSRVDTQRNIKKAAGVELGKIFRKMNGFVITQRTELIP